MLDLHELKVVYTGKKLSDCFALPHSVSIFIPSTYNVVEPLSPTELDGIVDCVAILLSDRFGGGNAENVRKGFWNSEVAGLVKENVIPVNASFDVLSSDNEDFIVALAESIKNAMKQESVYFMIDGEAFLV